MNELNDDKRAIELHIEEIVFHGFEPLHRNILANAVEHELERLLSERGLPGSTAAARVPSLKAEEIRVGPQREPKRIGAQVAGSVYQGLAGVTNSPGQGR